MLSEEFINEITGKNTLDKLNHDLRIAKIKAISIGVGVAVGYSVVNRLLFKKYISRAV